MMASDFERDFPPVLDKRGDAGEKTQIVSAAAKLEDVKLPRISLPIFSGDYLSWNTFHDLFKSLVDDNEHLSPVQKLQYLKAHLAGEAKGLLSNTAITSANYETAWNTLKGRYNNKKILVKTQLDVLFGQQTVNNESAKGVKSLLDKTSECIAALENYGIDTKNWDPILTYLVTQRLPYETLELWEQSVSSKKELPTWNELKEFLEARFQTLEVINLKRKGVPKEVKPSHITPGEKAWRKPQTFHVSASSNCVLCRGLHTIRQCSKYLSLGHQSRLDLAKSKGLCLNCLGTGHLANSCPSKLTCKICKKTHHTSLHRDQETSELRTTKSNVLPVTSAQSFAVTSAEEQLSEPKSFVVNSGPQNVLLATAIVKIIAPDGLHQNCRALIDPGSQASFVTENLVQFLRLRKEQVDTNVTGLGDSPTGRIRARVRLAVSPRNYQRETTIYVQAFVLNRITNMLPSHRIENTNWRHLDGIELADPTFDKPGRIDLLLGADVYSSILCQGIRKGEPGTPIGQYTIFGWILSGETSTKPCTVTHLQNFHVSTNLNDNLKAFWELEEIPSQSSLTQEEARCEQHFGNAYIRHPDGRYQVRLPFCDDETKLGASRHIAITRFQQMERRFKQNPQLKEEYKNCINEYIELGHMEETNTTEKDFLKQDKNGNTYFECSYLPHHAVFKPSSTTTKVRVVFDASRPTSNGKSLNDVLLKGPTIQETLFSIFMRWRKYKIAFMADVQKMYRQIRVHPHDAEYQRIIWRNTENEPMRDYKLTTVTFGVKSAPYLAIRTMQQLAKDESHNYPIGSAVILNDFYVDDLISGGSTTEEVLLKKYQITKLLSSGGFELRKWASNDERVLQSVPEENREVNIPLSANSDDIKALGILWNPTSDTLSYNIKIDDTTRKWTKRAVLSEIARLFDPMGWLSPITITAKIIIQSLWLTGLQWDDEIAEDIMDEWKLYRQRLVLIQDIRIPRWIRTSNHSLKVDLHGFCDASIKAYAAVIYMRIENPNGQIEVHLISAKTKVAPIKTITLPRLELCGATLLAKLMTEVKKDLQLDLNGIYAWTDSTIVLAWLRKHPINWETFVANRVSHIHGLLEGNCWAHVPTDSNPADCASRGLDPAKLKNHTLWWNGPSWLKDSEENWPKQKETFETTQGLRKQIKGFYIKAKHEHWDLLDRFSSLSKLVRVTAYCQRWVKNARNSPQNRKLSYLSSEELNAALLYWVISVQQEYFNEELDLLRKNEPIPRRSKLIKLNPFLHSDGLIRVGGRLRHSTLPFEEKHPIILPEKNSLTNLIVDNMHKTTLHGGAQLMLSLLRRKYWILNARNVVRMNNHKCIRCFRQTALTRTQLMGDLPANRIQRSRPFAHSGVDYCGPFDIKSSKGRGIRSYKGYIAVFICMVTKAMHLELVSDLSTAGFLAAFRRFIARRGLCSDVYSDCGSNFIGANAILTRYKLEAVKHLEHEIAQAIENQGIKWHFIPPSSPHFGGLWESGVKSVKTHLKRILENTILTFEEFNTLLTQIEATLNSRPITDISQDPDDMTALTPGHFLIGAPLLSPPEPIVLDTKVSQLDRYQYIQKLFQTFWTRWSSEYLQRLQQRPKWLSKQRSIRENDLVLVKDERLPPSRWLLGRVTKTHPGKDGLIRVVTIKTQQNIIKRPITKTCLLPVTTDT